MSSCLIIVLCVGFSVSCSVLGHSVEEAKVGGIIDDLVNDTINSFIDGLDDPLTLNVSFNRFNDVILTGWINASDFSLSGLKTIVANYIDVSYQLKGNASVNLTLTIGDLNLFSNYEASLVIGQLLPFSGKGNISANLDSLRISVFTLADVTLSPNTTISNFTNTTIDIQVGENTWLDIEGILSEELNESINEVISVLLARTISFINVNHERISKVLSPILQDILDHLFN